MFLRPRIRQDLDMLFDAMNQVNNKGKAPMRYYQDEEDLMVENQKEEFEVRDVGDNQDVDNDSDDKTI